MQIRWTPIERASARETAVRVAAGALAKLLLAEFGMVVFGYVVQLEQIATQSGSGTIAELTALRDASQGEAVEVALFGTNLTDRQYSYTGGSILSAPALPPVASWQAAGDRRLIGLQATYRIHTTP